MENLTSDPTQRSSRYELVPPDLRSEALRRFVAEQAVVPAGKTGGGLERGDLIRPIGAVLKFIHCDHPEDLTGPKFEASFEVSDLPLSDVLYTPRSTNVGFLVCGVFFLIAGCFVQHVGR